MGSACRGLRGVSRRTVNCRFHLSGPGTGRACWDRVLSARRMANTAATDTSSSYLGRGLVYREEVDIGPFAKRQGIWLGGGAVTGHGAIARNALPSSIHTPPMSSGHHRYAAGFRNRHTFGFIPSPARPPAHTLGGGSPGLTSAHGRRTGPRSTSRRPGCQSPRHVPRQAARP